MSVETVDPAGPPPMTTTSGWSIFVNSNLKSLGDVGRNFNRLHGFVRPSSDAGDRQRAAGDLRLAHFQSAAVPHRLPGHLHHADHDVELVLELERAIVLERRRDARP